MFLDLFKEAASTEQALVIISSAIIIPGTIAVLIKTFSSLRFLRNRKISIFVVMIVISWLISFYGLAAVAGIYVLSAPEPIRVLVPIMGTVAVMVLIMIAAAVLWSKEMFKISRLEIDLRAALSEVEKEKVRILEEKAREDAIINSIGDGILVTNQEGKITFLNRAAEELLGFTAREAIGKELPKLVPLLDFEGRVVAYKDRPVSRALMSGEKLMIPPTNYYVRKDSKRFPVSMTVTPIKVRGKIIGVIQDFRDDTVAHSIDKAKSEFVSLASHQLRTPLSTVNWYTEMLLTGDVGRVPQEQKKYLEEIYRSNQRMIDLVNSLLNVSRIELATITIEPEPTDLGKFIRKSFTQFDLYIRGKRLKVNLSVQKSLPKINVDQKLLSIVVDNLISNAISYTPEGGSIRAELYQLESSLSYNKDVNNKSSKIIFKISDTGYGIPRVAQGKIFSKLFRADNVREKNTTGSGLGLYIAKSIMDYTGGKIWFDSEENKGTTFYISIPLTGMKKKAGNKRLS